MNKNYYIDPLLKFTSSVQHKCFMVSNKLTYLNKSLFGIFIVIATANLCLLLPPVCLGKNVPNKATATTTEFDDWIISPNCVNRGDKLCNGYYLEPEYPYPINDQTEYPIIITSDEGDFVAKGTSTFSGDVIAKKGNSQLRTNKLIVVRDKQSGKLKALHAEGQVKLTEPHMRIDGTKADLFHPEQRKVIHNSKYRLYRQHARGQAESLTAYNNIRVELPNASYTTCAPYNNTWDLRAKKIKLNKDAGRGEAWHSRLYIKNVPVFYWPYMNFPIDKRRQTGFLMPSLHHSSSHGTTINTPYYWNIAPNYDATFTPHFMQKRYLKIDNQFRYLTSTSVGVIKFNLLPHDKAYKKFRQQSLDHPNDIDTNALRYQRLRDTKKRFSLFAQHTTNINKQLNLEIDYARAGDDNYLYDFSNDLAKTTYVNQNGTLITQDTISANQMSTTSLPQKIQLQYQNAFGSITPRLEQYQTLHPFDGPEASEPYRKLPEINLQSNTFNLPYAFNCGMFGSYTKFAMQNIPTLETNTTGNRIHLRPFIARPIIAPGWFIKPKVQWNVVHYKKLKLSLADQQANKATSVHQTTPMYEVNSGLIFERPLQAFNQSLRQTLEPRAYYLYVPHHSQQHLPSFDSGVIEFDYNQIFRDNRYNGFDRLGEANQLGLSIASRFLTNQTGEERANIALGRILYFKDRATNLTGTKDGSDKKWSPLALQAQFHIHPHWNITGHLVKESFKKTNNSSLNLQYIPDPVHIVNFGYQFTRDDMLDSNTGKPNHLQQAHLSSVWEITHTWRLFGKINYDLNLSRTTNTLLSLEKHGCCSIIKISWACNIKPSTNLSRKSYSNVFRLQFVLKGLTSLGSSPKSEIHGYNPKDHEF